MNQWRPFTGTTVLFSFTARIQEAEEISERTKASLWRMRRETRDAKRKKEKKRQEKAKAKARVMRKRWG